MRSEHGLELMMEALDGELPPDGRAELEAHLEQCADCREEWVQLQALEQLLRASPAAHPPVGFAGRIMARVDRRRRYRRALLGGLGLAAGALVAASLVFLPLLWSLPGAPVDLPPLVRTWGMLTARLVDVAGTVLNSLWLTASALALPVAAVSLCALATALVASPLWLALVRRLRPAASAYSG